MKNSIKYIIIFSIIISNKLSLFSNGRDYYLSFDLSGFLPIYTMIFRVNKIVNKNFTFGIGINNFWTLGSSINIELFGKITLFNTENYEFPISLGIIGGYSKEGSFGKTPKNYWGIGTHLSFTPITLKIQQWSVCFFSTGIIVITDFSWNKPRRALSDNSGLALSIYIFGVGVRYYLDL